METQRAVRRELPVPLPHVPSPIYLDAGGDGSSSEARFFRVRNRFAQGPPSTCSQRSV